MWDSIEQGTPFEWELGLQIMPEGDEIKYDFDILDATKIWPEDLIPVRRVGKMSLNRNPDNYFSETEQVAFNTTNIVPGIDFSNDPLLQGRNFSYLDTQLSRLGSPNFTELPINRPVVEVSNNQRDAHMRHTINKGRVSYTPASLDGHDPDEATPARGGFVSYPEQVSGPKVRQRSDSFGDHFGQARLFWNSMTPPEKEHIVKALQFELSKVETKAVRLRMLGNLQQVNDVLAAQVGLTLGEKVPTSHPTAMPDGTADSAAETKVLADATTPTTASGGLQRTSALSLVAGQPQSAKGRKIAILAAPGTDSGQVMAIQKALITAGATSEIVGPHLGMLEGTTLEAVKTFANTSSVLYDAVYVPGGAKGVEMLKPLGDPRQFIAEAYKHAKAIAATGEGISLVAAALPGGAEWGADGKASTHLGVVTQRDGADWNSAAQEFIAAISLHRHWGRADAEQIAA